MTPIQHPMCNDVLRKPAGMTEDECRDLHIRREDGAVWSFWQPNPEELLALNRGGAVALCVMGATHPPLSIMATHPTEPQEPRPVDESEYRHRMDAVNARLNALVVLTKQIVASWTSNTDDSPKRRGLIDRFLDLLNANRHDGSLVQPVQVDDDPGVTQSDLDRYRADAEGWKAEAERWRTVAEAKQGIDHAAIREFVQHLDDDRHWLDFRVNCEAWFEQTPEFFYRSGFNAAANAVLMFPEINPNPAEG